MGKDASDPAYLKTTTGKVAMPNPNITSTSGGCRRWIWIETWVNRDGETENRSGSNCTLGLSLLFPLMMITVAYCFSTLRIWKILQEKPCHTCLFAVVFPSVRELGATNCIPHERPSSSSLLLLPANKQHEQYLWWSKIQHVGWEDRLLLIKRGLSKEYIYISH